MTPNERIGQMVAGLLDDLDEHYGEGTEVVDALIAVEVMIPDGDGQATSIEHRCTTSRMTVAVGIAEAVRESLTAPYAPSDEDDDGDSP